MADESDEDDVADISPEEAQSIYDAMPEAVRAEVDKESDVQNMEMIHKFEMHAMDYENQSAEN